MITDFKAYQAAKHIERYADPETREVMRERARLGMRTTRKNRKERSVQRQTLHRKTT